MIQGKADIVARLKKELLHLQGFKSAKAISTLDIHLGPICKAFPNQQFPLHAIHEFICCDQNQAAASIGFISGIFSKIIGDSGVMIWVSSRRLIYPPALLAFGIAPERIIFVDLNNDREVTWAINEALKCNGLSTVVGELKNFDFVESRKFQLAVEESGVTGFIIRHQSKQIPTTACLTRWQINSLNSEWENEMPAVGHPRWKVDLLKVRNGQPGSWIIEWNPSGFKFIEESIVEFSEERKAG